jgi:hypothetical protein
VEIIAAMDRADLDHVQRAIDERRAAFQQFSTAPSVMRRKSPTFFRLRLTIPG